MLINWFTAKPEHYLGGSWTFLSLSNELWKYFSRRKRKASVSFSIEKFSRISQPIAENSSRRGQNWNRKTVATKSETLCLFSSNELCRYFLRKDTFYLYRYLARIRPNSQFLETRAKLVEEWFCRSSNDLSVSSRWIVGIYFSGREIEVSRNPSRTWELVRDGGKSGRRAVETRVAIGRSVGFKIIQNGKHPRVVRFWLGIRKRGNGMRQSCWHFYTIEHRESHRHATRIHYACSPPEFVPSP